MAYISSVEDIGERRPTDRPTLTGLGVPRKGLAFNQSNWTSHAEFTNATTTASVTTLFQSRDCATTVSPYSSRASSA
jgi:hypothetical protein